MSLDTLVKDIQGVIDGKGGWTSTVNDYFTSGLGETMMGRLGAPSTYPKGTLRMSSIGQPCERKLWYSINKPEEGSDLSPSTKLKFIYGDILEDFILSLAVAAGHTVEGRQDLMEIEGVKGHRDAVIDGVTVDVKSASSFSFKKFKEHKLEEEDPFGYLRQLGSYVYAAKDDPLVKDKEGGAFLAIDKQHGHLCLDYYNFKDIGILKDTKDFYRERIKSSSNPKEPKRGFSPEPEGKSGNMKLGVNCSYCDYKSVCHPSLRTFLYSRGPVFLTDVVKEPKVMEVT